MSTVTIDNLRYSLSGTTASITGYYSPPSGNLVIPSTITVSGTTYDVTSIGSNAFYFSTLTSVTIPSSITSIGQQAFVNITTLASVNFNSPSSLISIGNGAFSGCTSLTSITLPSSLTSINQQAFNGCTSLTSVNFNSPSSLISIGDAAFFGCTSLTSITLPSSLTSINQQAFNGCTSLTSVNFNSPSSLTSIGNSAFLNCTGLTSINIPSSVTSIDEGGFSGCTSLRNITINSFISNLGISTSGSGFYGLNNTNTSWTFNYSGAIPDNACNGRTNVTSVTFGSGITSIGENAFRSCSSLTSITLPSSITSIGNTAFRQSGLTSITIPSSVTSIGSAAFAFTKYLTNINVDSNNLNYSSQDGVLFNKNKTTLLQYPTWNSRLTYTVPSTVTTIENRSFGVFDLNENKLENIVLNEGLLTILDFAFVSCKFTQINLPNSLTNIGLAAFQSCLNLTSITIPSSVTNIAQQAFNLCINLTNVTFLGLIPTVGAFNFTNASDNITYNLPLNQGNPNLSAMLALFTTNTPLVPICFPAGTPVKTDQGITAIDKINPNKNTIRGKKIVAITKTVTLEDKIVCIEKDALAPSVPSQKTFISRQHKLLYNKQMIKAKNLVGQVDGVYNKKYNGEILYNVLLETHEKMLVNNLIVETLDPKNVVAQLYNGTLSVEERNNAIVTINQAANEYKKQYGKLK